MNKKQREAIAARMSKIATARGATVTLAREPGEICLTADFPDVSVSFEIDGLFGGGILAHWYGAKRDLSLVPGGFDSINPYHRRKATVYRDNADAFAAAFTCACDAVQSGAAFVDDSTDSGEYNHEKL